jgi:hypothetical protein
MRIFVTSGRQASGSFLLSLSPTCCDAMSGPPGAFYLMAMEGAYFGCLGAFLLLPQMEPVSIRWRKESFIHRSVISGQGIGNAVCLLLVLDHIRASEGLRTPAI